MAGYADTRELIINTLMGRPAGTEIQPEDHQAFALQITEYIRQVELVAGSGVPVAFAEPDTVPVQPDNGQAVYLSYVPRSVTKNFVNFINQSGNSISVTSSSGEVKLVTLLWNGSYWSSQIVTIDVLSDDSSVNASNIGASDYILFSTSSNYSIGDIVRYDGKLYKFTTEHAAGTWNGTDVELASINSILTSKLTELEGKVEDITREAAEDENETITIETNNGDIIASIDENGADFIGLKKGGKNVVATELIQEISTEEEEEEIIFEGDNGKEIISIGKNRLKVPKIEAESVVLTNSTTDINITSDDSITIEDGRCCSFIEGGSYLIKGVGNAIINISFASKSFSDVSYGFMWSWESQQIAYLIAQGITIKKYDESSAEKYRIQGGTFQRINKHDSSSDSVFEVKSDSSDAWSLLITKKAERFVKPSVKPICIIYDGGRWQGQVYWEGQLYKIWDLHRKLEIPYAVALYSAQMEPSSGAEYTCDEVRRDIESGLCEVIVRNVSVNKDNDSAYLDGIKSEQSLLKVTSKATILASHHLTPLIFRCSVKDGADFIRQYPFFDTDGILACKYSDSPYKAIHSATIPISLNEQTNFWLPQIYWSHGVGIPPEGETMYSDTTGENTQNGFRQLLSLVKDGKVQILHPSDFAQFCKNLK